MHGPKFKGGAAIALAALLLIAAQASKPDYQTTLEGGFADMLAGLEKAERNLSAPEAMAPPLAERRLRDGYRYLMGHLVRVATTELDNNPSSPRFERSVTFLSKWTGDNPDNAYLGAPIDGRFEYRVSGSVPYYRGNSAARLADIPQAPGLVLFQTNTNLIGDTGSLAELGSCRNQSFGGLNNHDLIVSPDGSFEILLSAERPVGFEGNWMATQGELECRDREGNVTRAHKVARKFAIREIFIDWDEELPLDLDIVRIGHEGVPPPRITTRARAEQLRTIGEKVPNQIQFWNGLMEVGLEAWGDKNGDGVLNLPVNAVNPPAPPFVAGGTAGSNQIYSAGMYDLTEGEALILSLDIPRMPEYLGFQLSNAWMESYDQANYTSSRNQGQMEFDEDGNSYLVISERDPGVRNWVDTTGIPNGQMSFRFWYAEEAAVSARPVIRARKVGIDEVRERLPAAAVLTSEQRRAEVAVRQKHIRQRFRQY